MASIADLPKEILLIIFNFCSNEDVLGSVQHVCQVWHDLAMCPHVWQHRTLVFPKHQSTDVFIKRLQLVPFVRSLTVYRDYDRTVFSAIFKVCPGLRRLKVSCIGHVLLDLSCFRNLRYLEITFDKEGTSIESHLGCYVAYLPLRLQTLIFLRCYTKGFVPLGVFQSCHYLEHFVISSQSELCDILNKLLQNNVNNHKMIPGKHNLQTVYLCGPSFFTHAVREALSEYPNLQYFGIKEDICGNNEILEFVIQRPLPSLKYLDISYTVLNSRIIDTIAEMYPNLVYLSLRRCHIGDQCLYTIINSLSKLQHLNLHGTYVTSLYFDLIPVKLPHLINLNLCACRKIDETMMRNLVEKMPNLIIVQPRKTGLLRGSQATGRNPPFPKDRKAI